MTGYEPKAGHRVRVTRVVEGTVERLEDGADHGTRVLLRSTRPVSEQRMGFGWVHYGSPEETIERLPDPEPEWQPGDVVVDRTGRTFLRADTGDDEPWVTSSGAEEDLWWWQDGALRRPLTLLVRDGKPVQS